MMKKILMAALTVLAALLVASGCSSQQVPTESVTVALAQFESTALVFIADDQGYFRENGLDVMLRDYDTGAGALEGMLNNEADIAVGTAEFPLVAKAFKQEKIGAIGSLAKSEYIYIVGRKDRGLESAPDLKGKKVGTTVGTIAEFYLGRYLELNGMTLQDIILVDIKAPADYSDAIASGEVDAIASAQPAANAIKARLGDNAVFWPAQSGQRLYSLIIASNEWITGNPEANRRFLRSLAQAEDFAIANPDEAKSIIQKGLNLDAAYMETVWSQNQFGLSLDQSLVTAMEDEARWMIINGITSETAVPDLRGYIREDGLESVKSDAVSLIRMSR